MRLLIIALLLAGIGGAAVVAAPDAQAYGVRIDGNGAP
jgi:hypothetical protein